jgi:tetratricopeptide (TPR) repeat protein
MRWKQSTILFAAAAVLTLCACSSSPQAKEAKFLEKGKKAYQAKDYAVAIIQFKNAAAAQPRDAEPYYQLGLAYLAATDYNNAVSCFRKATELDPKHTGAQLKLAALMATSRTPSIIEDAQKRTEEVLKLAPEDIEALNVLAITELKLGKPESAEAHLEQALKKSPDSLRSSVALAQTRLARKDVKGAEEALQAAAAQAPKSPLPSDYLGEFYLAQGKTAEAEQQFRRAIQIDPKHGPALVALGGMQARAGQTAQADQTYRQVAALPDKQYRPVHALYLFQSGKREEALAEFQKLNKEDPSDRDLRTYLVRAYLALNRVGDAEKVLTAVLQKNKLDVDALLQRSRIYLGSRRFTDAQTDLNQVIHFRSNSAEAHYLLAKAYLGRGDSALEQQELGEALKVDPAYIQARIELAQALIANRAAQSALQLLDQAPEAQKGIVGLVLQRNWALLSLGQTAEARQSVDRVLAAAKVPEALLQDSILKLLQKDYAGARATADQTLSQAPEDTRALSVLVQSYAAQKQLPAALQRVREHAAKQPKSAPVQQFLGQVLAANGDPAGARKAFEAAAAANPGLTGPAIALAEMDANEGKRDEARKRLSTIMAAHPDSLPGQLLWAQVEFEDGKSAAAIDHFRKALTMNDSNMEALNGLAYLLAEAGQPDEALKYAQKAKELAPDSPAVADTLGWTYFKKGLYPLAVTNLESAIAKEGTPRRRYHLAMAYLKAGDPTRGRQTLEAALKSDPKLPEAQMAKQMFGDTGK